jgi:nucleotide-binding universal stress UspA family protein
MNGASKQTIVVGVSGSQASAAALLWAADEARRRDARLRIVQSWEPLDRAPYALNCDQPTAAQLRDAASLVLKATMRTAFGSTMPDDAVAELTEGRAERALIDQSLDADLLVLGERQPAAGAGRSVGPVVRTCLTSARCPVVIVSTEAGHVSDGQPGRRRAALPASPSTASDQPSAPVLCPASGATPVKS